MHIDTLPRIRRKRWTAGLFFALALLFAGPLLLSSQAPQKLQAAEEELGLETPGTLRVGMEGNYAPFNWSQITDEDGAVPIFNSPGEYAYGYDVWIAKQLAEKLDLKLEILKTDWEGLTPALFSGRIDAIIAGMSPTPDRLKEIDFSDIYYRSDLVLVVRKDSPYAGAVALSDFSGAHVTGALNSFSYGIIEQIPGVHRETAMDSFPTMISSLLSGKVDSYICERPAALAAVRANRELSFIAFKEGEGFVSNPADTAIAVGLRKGSPIRVKMNQILAEIPESERQAAMERMVALQDEHAAELEEAAAEENTESESAAPPSFFATVYKLLREYGPLFLNGTLSTMVIAIVGTFLGFIIGLLVQILRSVRCGYAAPLAKRLPLRVIQFLCNAYVEIFRGTPMMVQAMLIFYGGKLFFNVDLSALVSSFIIVSVNSGAYLAEIVRGGIDSVDPGQWEACEAIGLSHWESMTKVILPQTMKAIFPAIGNEFVTNIKDTSVLNVIAVSELFFATRSVAGATLKVFQSYFITAVIYFILTFAATRFINALAARGSRVRPFLLSSEEEKGADGDGADI